MSNTQTERRCPRCGTMNTDGWPLPHNTLTQRIDFAGCSSCWSNTIPDAHDFAMRKCSNVYDFTFGLISLPDGRFRAYLPYSGEALSGYGADEFAAIRALMSEVERLKESDDHE